MRVEETYKRYAEWVKNKPINFELFNQHAIINHSDSIEGSTLTLDETRLLLDQGLTPKNKPIEHSLMAIDHFKALQFMLSLAVEKVPLTIELIHTLGGLIKKSTGSVISSMGGTHDETKGEFRKNSVYAGSRMFVDYQKVPDLIGQLIVDINNQINQSTNFIEVNKLAFKAHYQMLSIHPFSDGNGRASRLLMNYVQQYYELPMTIVFSEDKSDYIEALEKTRSTTSFDFFESFMFAQTDKTMLFFLEKDKKDQMKLMNKKGFNLLF